MNSDTMGIKPIRHKPLGKEVAEYDKTYVLYSGEQEQIVELYGRKAQRNGYETIEVNGKTYSRPLEDEETQLFFSAFLEELDKEEEADSSDPEEEELE